MEGGDRRTVAEVSECGSGFPICRFPVTQPFSGYFILKDIHFLTNKIRECLRNPLGGLMKHTTVRGAVSTIAPPPAPGPALPGLGKFAGGPRWPDQQPL